MGEGDEDAEVEGRDVVLESISRGPALCRSSSTTTTFVRLLSFFQNILILLQMNECGRDVVSSIIRMLRTGILDEKTYSLEKGDLPVDLHTALSSLSIVKTTSSRGVIKF